MSTTPLKKAYAFGTSGYRSDQEEGFNDAVVRQITGAIADYLIARMQAEGEARPVLIGGDTREKSKRYIPIIADLLKARGLDVYVAEGDLPTPVLAYAAKHFDKLGLPQKRSAGAILMTASHNPWEYGGYNFLTPDAAVVPSVISKEFERLQQAPENRHLDRPAMGLTTPAEIRPFDPYEAYKAHLKEEVRIDYAAIRDANPAIFYDPLYATGRKYFPRLLAEEGISIEAIHTEDERPAGYAGMPEPSGKNLNALAEKLRAAPDGGRLKVGFANDGDSDRFGVLDETGHYLLPNEVLAMVLYHLTHHRQQTGVVVRSQATSHILDALATQAGLSVVQTPVGYKYIAEEFIEREEAGHTPVLLGGESSGGLSIGGHIPEKDGLLANLLVAELVALEKKPVSRILKQVYDSVPQKFAFLELAIHTDQGKQLLEHYLAQESGSVAGFAVDTHKTRHEAEKLQQKFSTRDGAKLYLQDGGWVLVRISGTEPLARIYAETVGATVEEAQEKLALLTREFRETLSSRFSVSDDAITVKS
jgi:phosphomannomutase